MHMCSICELHLTDYNACGNYEYNFGSEIRRNMFLGYLSYGYECGSLLIPERKREVSAAHISYYINLHDCQELFTAHIVEWRVKNPQ